MSQGSDLLMTKHADATRLRMLMRVDVLLRLPGLLVRGQVFLLSQVVGGAMGMLGPFM
jgi:hypothetical protein